MKYVKLVIQALVVVGSWMAILEITPDTFFPKDVTIASVIGSMVYIFATLGLMTIFWFWLFGIVSHRD